MQATRVTSKGQVTIPKAVRQRLGIAQGTRVAFDIKGERVELRVVSASAADPAASAFGLVRSRREPVPADLDPAALMRAARR